MIFRHTWKSHTADAAGVDAVAAEAPPAEALPAARVAAEYSARRLERRARDASVARHGALALGGWR